MAAGGVVLTKHKPSDLDAAPAGKVRVFIDDSGRLAAKDEAGAVVTPEALIASLEALVATKQDASTAATDSELASERTAREGADAVLTTAAAAAKAVADAALPKAGGTMTGALTLSGDPTNALHAATRQYVLGQIAALVNGAPEALDTLKEIGDALKAAEASDNSALEALTALVEAKLTKSANLSDLASASTARANLGLGSAATQPTSAFDAAGLASTEEARAKVAESGIKGEVSAEKARAETAEALKAPLASPALTGTPTAPTAAEADNSTKVATTAYTDRAMGSAVKGASAGGVPTWGSGQTYKPNALVAFNNQLYIARSEHTSGAGFEHAKWQPINPLFAECTPEFWGAKGDSITDDTVAAQLAENFVFEQGGGEVLYGPYTYIVDGLEWMHQVRHRGSAVGTTKIKAKAGSTNPGQILQAKGLVKHVGWKYFTFEPNGNVGQLSFYMFAETGGATEGGVSYADFEHCTWLGEWSGHAMWWDGGKSGAKFPHQFINFKQCFISHRNSGGVSKAANGELIGPTTARAIKCTGQCAKFTFDGATSLQGREPEIGPVGSCNIELGRKFTFATTLKSDAAAGATKINVESATGFAANQVFTIGEGYHNELCEVESVSGTEITLKAALVFAHAAADTNLRLLVAGATNTPAFFTFESGCTIQNADLHILAEGVRFLNTQRGSDLENQARGALLRKECRQVNLDMSLNGASRGTTNGTGTLTVGSATVTASGGAWAEGDTIFGKGIKPGTTVTNVTGSTLTISNPVEANGTEGPVAAIPLIKGGDGEGFIAKFEGESEGSVSYDRTGAVDREVVQV